MTNYFLRGYVGARIEPFITFWYFFVHSSLSSNQSHSFAYLNHLGLSWFVYNNGDKNNKKKNM